MENSFVLFVLKVLTIKIVPWSQKKEPVQKEIIRACDEDQYLCYQ